MPVLLSTGAFSPPEDLAVGIDLIEIPRPALFLAGKAFRRYRARGGSRTGVLPDFFIGAHAAVAQVPLLTRDPRPYRTYFTGIALIAPDETAEF
jgi:predicted nucleic acid-binding protein